MQDSTIMVNTFVKKGIFCELENLDQVDKQSIALIEILTKIMTLQRNSCCKTVSVIAIFNSSNTAKENINISSQEKNGENRSA